MKQDKNISRRFWVKSAAFGILAVSIPSIGRAKTFFSEAEAQSLFHRYPAIDDTIVSEVVGLSHFDLEKLKTIVDKRPELARATWDWGFGDWETAIGAASHVGRHDIINYLISKGARPDIFTFAALGKYNAVKSMIESQTDLQKIRGPHGISLMRHVNAGSQEENLSDKEKDNFKLLHDYLMTLEDADDNRKYLELTDDEKQKYLGDYMYGEGENDGFTIKINMRKLLSLGKLGKFGGGLYPIQENVFEYNGAPSTQISFQWENDKIVSLTVTEPDLVLVAKKAQ